MITNIMLYLSKNYCYKYQALVISHITLQNLKIKITYLLTLKLNCIFYK